MGENRRRRDETGANLVEYLLLVSLIAIIAMMAITFFGDSTSQKFSTVGSTINADVG